MTVLLPGSSEPCESEIERLQQWCERAPLGIPVPSGDLHDFDQCIELISKIHRRDQCSESDMNGVKDSKQAKEAHRTKTSRFINPRWIGSGAHGIIFSAIDSEHGNIEVAIKILRPSRLRNRVTRERFIEEAKLMEGLKHPCIAEVVEIGVIEEHPYMVTEFAGVGSLASALVSNPNGFTVRQAAWLVKQIAEAVHYAHSIPILHRDIKPGNILLRKASSETSEGSTVWPLLTDFGLSKNLGVSPTTPRTRQGEVLGTLAYMSPEQVRGEPLKTQSDIFPLGVILYELTHGCHPFLSKSNFETQQNIVQGSIPKNGKKNRKVSRVLEAIIGKCLQKNPDERYRAASDLATDLGNFLLGKPISVSPPTPLELLTQLVRSNPIAATFLTTTCFALLAIIVLLNHEWRVQRELADATKMVAEERAEIGKLFLESMRVNNRGIYDAILSFQRVSTDALQLTLEKQIPLLESALELDPTDSQLIRQLEVNYHYLSLCIKVNTNKNHLDYRVCIDEATNARTKSLEYIDLLLKREPENRGLRMAKTNGLYWLSMLYLDSGRPDEALSGIYKALAHGNQFTESNPGDNIAQETVNGILLLLADQLIDKFPEKSLDYYSQVSDASFNFFSQDPSRLSNLIYAMQACSRRSALLVKLGRIDEARSEVGKVRDLFADYNSDASDVWALSEELYRNYTLICSACADSGEYGMLVEVADEWRAFAKLTVQNQFDLKLNYSKLSSADVRELIPLYFRWVALSKNSNVSSLHVQGATDDLRLCIERCVTNPEFTFDPPDSAYSYSSVKLTCLDALRQQIEDSRKRFAK